MTAVVVVASIIAVAVVVGWFFATRKHPENASTHEPPDRVSTSEQLYGGADRPAGPDAEATDPSELGGDQSDPAAPGS